jgi:AraC-like DNA-binding protein
VTPAARRPPSPAVPTPAPSPPSAPPSVVAFVQRDRARLLLKAAFPRRKARVVLTRTAQDFDHALRATLVDVAIVDVGSAHDETWRAAAFAREFPSVPFFGVAALRAGEGPALAQCAAYEFVDVLVDGVDDAAARDILVRHAFTTRFATALGDPPRALSLDSALQRAAWRCIVAQAGRPVRTSAIARALRVTREHLSRTFAADGCPNLKRVIDLVRLIAAAELAKNPGYDIRDVARLLDFASSSHLSTTAQRIVGTKPPSLARLRTVDLVERFVRGHERSRG